MATFTYPKDNKSTKARVVFRSYKWTANNSPNLANTKDIRKQGIESEIQLFLPGQFQENYAADWKPEEVITMATGFNIDSALTDGARAVVKTINGAGFSGVTNTGKFVEGITEFPGEFLVFQKGAPVTLSFNFDMIPRSQPEAQEIMNIVDQFKKQIFPTYKGVILHFPNIWTVSFTGIKGPGFPDGGVSRYDDMALTGVVPTYGGGAQSALVFHDGHPTNVGLALTFQSIKHSYIQG